MAEFAPRWRYHPQLGGRLITSAEQLACLSEGWYDSPAAFGHETHPSAPPVAIPLPGTGVSPAQAFGSAVLPPPAPAVDPLLAGRVASLEAQVKSYEGEIIMLAEAVRELQSRVMSAEQELAALKPAAPEPKHPGASAPADPRRK
jgi:hypothetical protein